MYSQHSDSHRGCQRADWQELVEDTHIPHIAGQPSSLSTTKPFPAEKYLSRAISVNPKMTEMVGNEELSVFPSYRPEWYNFLSFSSLSWPLLMASALTKVTNVTSALFLWSPAQNSPTACWLAKWAGRREILLLALFIEECWSTPANHDKNPAPVDTGLVTSWISHEGPGWLEQRLFLVWGLVVGKCRYTVFFF